MKSSERHPEVLVVGGGPAGAAAAIELASQGADVLLVERRSFPRPKVCGGCLGPRAIACLHHLGIDPAALDGAVRLDRVRIAVAGGRATLPLQAGAAVDRAQLDLGLLERARTAGAEVWTEARARIGDEVGARRAVHVEGRGRRSTVTAPIVVLATGLPSVPATAPGARVGLSQTRGTGGGASGKRQGPDGTVAVESLGPAEGEVQMVAGLGGYVGMVRFGDGRLNVAASMLACALEGSSPGEQVDKILLDAGLQPLRWCEGWTGTPPLRARPFDEVADRVLPVGDAAGFWEPFTGEGIGWGLEAGIAVAPVARDLGRAWDQQRAAAWMRQRRAWMRKVQSRSRAVAAISAHPRLARAALGLIRRLPVTGRWLMPASGPPENAPGVARGAA